MNWEFIFKLLPFLCKMGRLVSGRRPNRGTVLIIEDNGADAIMLEIALKKLNYDCQIATSAEVAQGILQTSFFSVIFVDLRLPGMSGQALLRVLSREVPNARLVVICGEPSDLHDAEPGVPIVMIRKKVNVDGLMKLFAMLKVK